jgi:hypothetical protein
MPVLPPEAVRINPADSNSEVAIVIDGENPSSSYTLQICIKELTPEKTISYQ